MADSTVFTNNRTQAVRLPAETRFPDAVKKVAVRVVGVERIVAPINATWDSFFLSGPLPTDDFMTERASQHQVGREPLDATTHPRPAPLPASRTKRKP